MQWWYSSKEATHISIFRLGYLLACISLLLFGTTLLLTDTGTHLTLWGCCILYIVTFIIVSNTMLSLLSYISMEQTQATSMVHPAFQPPATVKGYYGVKETPLWVRRWHPPGQDSVCFLFLPPAAAGVSLHLRAQLQASALQASRRLTLYNGVNLKSIDHPTKTETSLTQCRQTEPVVPWLDHTTLSTPRILAV